MIAKNRSLVFVLAGAVAAIALGWGFLAVVESGAKKWEAKISAKEARVVRLSGLSARRTSIETASRRFESYWSAGGRSEEAEWSDFLKEIDTAALRATAKTASVRRGGIVAHEGWREYRVDFEVTANMAVLTRLFESLDASQNLTRIARAQIVITPERKGLFKASVTVTRAVIA